MNLSSVAKVLVFCFVWITVTLTKLTGVYLIVWLFCPRTSDSNWVFLWSPFVHELPSMLPRVYWLGWVYRTEHISGSGPETCEFWYQYSWESFHRSWELDRSRLGGTSNG